MNWIISINGLPCEEDEIREQIKPLLKDKTNLEDIVADIIEAGKHADHDILDFWEDKETKAIWSVSFDEPPTSMVISPVMEVVQRTIDTEIAITASKQLLVDLNDHFVMSETSGFLTVNHDNPPEVEQSGELIKRLMGLGVAAERLEEFGKWQVGAALCALESHHGPDFDVSQYVELTKKAYNTMITSKNTFEAFHLNRYKLSFTHHKEAFYSNLPGDCEERLLMHRCMELCEIFQLSCANQRKLFRYVRNYGVENLNNNVVENWADLTAAQIDESKAEQPSCITNTEELLDRISVHSASKNYLFKLNDKVLRFRGFVDALPEFAEDVICTDDWKRLEGGGRELPIDEWHIEE